MLNSFKGKLIKFYVLTGFIRFDIAPSFSNWASYLMSPFLYPPPGSSWLRLSPSIVHIVLLFILHQDLAVTHVVFPTLSHLGRFSLRFYWEAVAWASGSASPYFGVLRFHRYALRSSSGPVQLLGRLEATASPFGQIRVCFFSVIVLPGCGPGRDFG